MSEGHKEICRVFASGEYCKYGKRCRYLHFRPPSRNFENQVKNDELSSVSASEQDIVSQSETQSLLDEQNTKHDIRVAKSRYSGIGSNKAHVNSSNVQAVSTDANLGNLHQKTCYSYVKTGNCRYSNKCRFLHNTAGVNKSFEDKSGENSKYRVQTKSDSRTTCQFFLKGHCRYGENCQRSHDVRVKPQKQYWRNSTASKVTQPIVVNNSIFDMNDVTKEDLEKARLREINILLKRYPRAVKTEINVEDCFDFVFSPTDPDWPYDIKDVGMRVQFPAGYPVDPMNVTFLENKLMPSTLHRYLWRSVEEWISERHKRLLQDGKTELVFRPFGKWLDKEIEDLFTAGLKLYQKELMAEAAGIQLVPASQLQEEYRQKSVGDGGSSGNEDLEESSSDEDQHDDTCSEDDDTGKSIHGAREAARRGTEVKLHNLQLKENTATLIVKRVMMVLQCERCKHRADLSTPVGRLNRLNCDKCMTEQLVTFNSSIVHQFSSVVGYVDVQGCDVFDVVLAECEFEVSCLKCNKQVLFGNILPGQPKDTWCRVCHAKLRVAADCAKTLKLQPSVFSDTTNAHAIETKKSRKPPKDPAIQVGNPLPENGTCKHYKKSYRWLRFPCCGKLYPCDVCHDSTETHEMKFANRMICGFCSTEQAFAGDRPCKACNAFIVKKASVHWEGGKGCRDKVKMSRSDVKKYADQNKTISKKAQAKSSTGKKSTKIRHL